jgi:hypothetical protein
MKYGVIVCSKCKMAKGVNLYNKTTRCNRCGKIINIKKVKILFKTESAEKLRYYIGVTNAKINK